MNFIERLVVRKEIDMSLSALKKYWPTGLHILAVVVTFADPSVRAFLTANPQYSAIGLLVWAEVTHWLQSPKNVGALATNK